MPNQQTSHKRKQQQLRRRHGQRLYDAAEPTAYWLKVLFQMLIGGAAIVGLIAVLFCGYEASGIIPMDAKDPSVADHALALVGAALVLAAGVELAHTLFTAGPDEAVEPVILGVAAALLLQLSKNSKFTPKEGATALLYAIALVVLFGVRKYLLEDDDDEELPSPLKSTASIPSPELEALLIALVCCGLAVVAGLASHHPAVWLPATGAAATVLLLLIFRRIARWRAGR